MEKCETIRDWICKGGYTTTKIIEIAENYQRNTTRRCDILECIIIYYEYNANNDVSQKKNLAETKCMHTDRTDVQYIAIKNTTLELVAEYISLDNWYTNPAL